MRDIPSKNKKEKRLMLLNGIAYWAQIVGDPRDNDYNPGQRNWSIDVALNTQSKAQLEAQGLGSKIKNKGDARGDFITFKRNEFKKDGETRNQAIRIIDHHGNPWKRNVLIGNGSEVNVQYNVYDGFRGQKGVAILAVQVWGHVPYEAKTVNKSDDFPVKTEDEGEIV